MKHYILYYHGGSSNHGCEALVRTTAELLNYKKNRISLMSFRPNDDKKYGIDQFCDIHSMNEKKKVPRKSYTWIKSYFEYRITQNKSIMEDLPFLNAIGAKKGDVALSIGGDNYCYNDTVGLRKANELWRRNGIKTVLWGCSIEPELLNNPEIAEDISRFDLITARESISYEAIKKVNQNTILVSDSAFWLKTQSKQLPNEYDSCDIVGLNLSPLAEEYEVNKGLARKNYETLIEHILSNTNMKILLIPHVVLNYADDRMINQFLHEKYRKSNRVQMIEDCNCEELKGYISKCRFFIGARTHATIAAYSSGVPTIVLGYSVKSKGIAKDLFGEQKLTHLVLPIQNLMHNTEMLNAFLWLQDHEKEIKKTLLDSMPEYKKSINNAVEIIEKI